MRRWYLSLCMDGVWSAGWIEISFMNIEIFTRTQNCGYHLELNDNVCGSDIFIKGSICVKFQVLWNAILCSPLNSHRRFGRV